MAKAIEIFEATLLTPDSPFDRYLNGDDTALNNQKEGLGLFMSKGCRSAMWSESGRFGIFRIRGRGTARRGNPAIG